MRRMRFVISSITFAAACLTAATNQSFHAGPAGDYAHQSSESVTVGAKAYDNPELVTEAFGKKLDLLRYGVLPVLVVVENKRNQAIDLRDLEVSLGATDGRHAAAVPPEQLLSLGTPHGARSGGSQIPLPVPLPKKKNPLNAPELVERGFSAKMLPPGDSASGFFYFEAKAEAGDKLYLNGVQETKTGKQLLYFEFPLDGKSE